MSLAAKKRRQQLQALKQNSYDLIIIGGGITGAGIALDAVTRGMKVALFDKGDFAAGASSRSTKMIHGGLRYLQKFQFRTVAKAGQERAVLYENAPHVMTREKLLLPIYKGGTLGKLTTAIGLKVYDYLISAKDDERRTLLSRKEVLAKMPAIRAQGLRGGAEYTEYRTDDARLTLEVIKKAVEEGADCYNYLEAIHFNYDENGNVEAVIAQDKSSGNRYLIEGRVVLNAAGAWSYDIAPEALDLGESIHYIKGAHLVFDQSVLPLEEAVYFDTGSDQKMIFAIPHGSKTYVGVSSARYQGKRELPTISTLDTEYLLLALNEMFPTFKLTRASIESSWAGVAPILINSDARKGDKALLKTLGNGLVMVKNGRLTGYRELAQSVVDEIALRLQTQHNLSFKPCQTATITLSGGDVGGSDNFARYKEEAIERGVAANLTAIEAAELVAIYGSNVDILFEIAAKANPDEMQGLPMNLYVKLVYGLMYEAVMTPSDFLIRRTGMLYFNIAELRQYQVSVVKFMARYFGWTVDHISQYNAELEQALFVATHFVEDEGVVKLVQID